MKGKGKASNATRTPPSTGGGGGILDKLLVPRIINYAINNRIDDLDEVAQALRSTYREYQRKQLAPFKVMVARAIKVVERKGGIPAQPEVLLQVRSMAHGDRSC